jgi:hypothetical protein
VIDTIEEQVILYKYALFSLYIWRNFYLITSSPFEKGGLRGIIAMHDVFICLVTKKEMLTLAANNGKKEDKYANLHKGYK